MLLSIKKGLDIPLSGTPHGGAVGLPKPSLIALNLAPFEELRFRILIKPEERVKIGQPLVENRAFPGQYFVAPAAGVIKEIRRGLKRRLLDIVIEVAPEEEEYDHGTLALSATPEAIISHLMKGGIFPHIRLRPFNLVSGPKHLPRDIFVRALESAPFVPPAEMQVEGHEEDFAYGLEALSKLTKGKVHLVYSEKSQCKAFLEARGVEKHSARGPHPISLSSLHIQKIAPIKHAEDFVWTLSTLGVIALGKMLRKGRYHKERILAIGGNGIIEGRQGYIKGREGYPIASLITNRIKNEPLYLISGDPLTGEKVEAGGFLGFYETVFSALPVNVEREFLHFFRLGLKKYSATHAYLSGHLPHPTSGYDFTTSQHGEERAFIDGAVYEKVMPLRIPTMQLVKAVLAEDFERAEALGLLEVSPEDFALPTFICPSKIEMIEIIKRGLHLYSKEMGH